MRPSLLISAFSATIAIIAFILSFSVTMPLTERVKILLLLSIAFGIHGAQHAHDELYYDFNPMIPGKFDNVWRDEPVRLPKI